MFILEALRKCFLVSYYFYEYWEIVFYEMVSAKMKYKNTNEENLKFHNASKWQVETYLSYFTIAVFQ